MPLSLESYDPWPRSVLGTLQACDSRGAHAAQTILDSNIAILIIDNDATNLWWKVKVGVKGIYIQNTLYVSRFIADKPADDPWVLMEFVHETRHLEQGFWTACSVYGELEAWQLGFRFYETLPNHSPLHPLVEELLKLPLSRDLSILKEAQKLINTYENGNGTFFQQAWSVLKKEKSMQQIYWINALPLRPLIPSQRS